MMKTLFPDDPEHPIWKFYRMSLAMVCLTAILWSNANDFDGTEIKAILEMAAVYFGISMVGPRAAK